MRIELRRTGGFAGIARTLAIDTSELPAARAAEIERLAKAVRVAPARARRASPDAFTYEVTLDGATFAVEENDPLIEVLERRRR